MNRLNLLRIGVLAVVLLLLASCDGDTAAQPDIPAQDPDLVATGANAFEANCAECHGADLRGTDRGPSLLSEVYVPSHHGDGAFQIAVLTGSPQHHWDFGPMPPVEGLTEADVEAIIAFVRETQRTEGFEP
jgi:mono/diheme cytochrome c family protein